MIICCTVPKIWHVTDVLFYFWAIFCPFTPPPPAPPDNPKNQNFKKMKKNPWRYRHLTQVYQKSWSNALLFLRYVARQTDGWTDIQMDGWTDGKSDIVVGAQPKKKFANENTVLNFIFYFTKVTELIFSLKHIKNKLHCYECTYTKTEKQRPRSTLKV